MKVVVFGGTKGMGRAVARQLFEAGNDVVLLGRDKEDLDRSAADLSARKEGGKVATVLCDLEQVEGFDAALDAADGALGNFDTVVVTAGLFATQDKLEADPAFTHRLLLANFTNTVMFCENVRKRLLSRGGGTLCVFSSVAGDRGRKPVAIYGATKAGLTHYLDSLDFKFRAAGLRTICVKPGFVKTAMTAGLKPPPFAGEPEGVARIVVRAIKKGTPQVYAPPMWRLIMMVIGMLPRFVMRKIGF
jgi:decaprenylphospho-beta-D-erythro-pentofuranosid-2-ulose 2-reductase